MNYVKEHNSKHRWCYEYTVFCLKFHRKAYCEKPLALCLFCIQNIQSRKPLCIFRKMNGRKENKQLAFSRAQDKKCKKDWQSTIPN